MLVNKDHSLNAAANTHPNSYLHICFVFFSFLIRVKPPESKTIHHHCSLVLFSIHSTQAIQRLLLLINTYRYLHMYSRQAQVSEERAYRVSLLHISKDNCVYEIVMICAAYTDPLKKKKTDENKNPAIIKAWKGAVHPKLIFTLLKPGWWSLCCMFFSLATLLEFYRETESNICQCHCFIQVQLVWLVFNQEHLGSKTASSLCLWNSRTVMWIRKCLLVHKPSLGWRLGSVPNGQKVTFGWTIPFIVSSNQLVALTGCCQLD